jgi:hypothetical protein
LRRTSAPDTIGRRRDSRCRTPCNGDQWEIPYLLPFSDVWQWAWAGQWALDAWQNRAIGLALFVAVLVLAWRRGFSLFEIA